MKFIYYGYMLKVGIFFGGPGHEHKISLLSAVNVLSAVSKKYQVVPVGVDKNKRFVDGFLTPNHKFIVNEINTMPGFTKISMYPKLWSLSDLPLAKLAEKLIDLAQEK